MSQPLILRTMQAVLFTTPYSMEHKLDFASEFIKRTGKVFTADPNIVTAPQNAPPQVPRIEIRSPDQSHIAQFTKNRIVFIYQDTHNSKIPLGAGFPSFHETLRSEAQCVMEFLNPRVVRLGFVVGLIAELGYSANRFLSEECLQDNLFPDAHEMNLGILYKLRIEPFSVNRWVRYRTLRAKNDPSIDYAMAIDIDINTLAEEMHNYTASEILEFYRLANDHITTNLNDFPLFGVDFSSEGG